MASETESLTVMRAALQKAGLTTTENAQRMNHTKHSENLKKQEKQNNVVHLPTIRKPNQNRKNNGQKAG